MPDLIGVTFPNEDTAFELRSELIQMQTEYVIALEDAVVVTRDDAGEVKLHQAVNLTAAGAAGGSLRGLLLGALFASPLFGALLGAGAGALSGKLSDIGINDEFMRDLAADFEPGTAALFVLVRSATPEKVLAGLQDFRGKGRVLRTSVSAEKEADLRALLEANEPA